MLLVGILPGTTADDGGTLDSPVWQTEGISYLHEDVFPPGFGDAIPKELHDQEADCLDTHSDGSASFIACGFAEPVCVKNPSIQHHGRLFYAQREDQPDEYEEAAPKFRDQLRRANAMIRHEALRFWGVDARLKVLCDAEGPTAGLPTVTHVVVRTGDGAASPPSQIATQGYAAANSRAWIYDPFGGNWGAVPGDNRPGRDNANNRQWSWATVSGAGASDRNATNFGVHVLAHEIGHSLGAVQIGTPHANPGGHCNDGKDIMCYPSYLAPGGLCVNACGSTPNQLVPKTVSTFGYSPVTPGCTDYAHFDCNHDDYFNLDPEPGSFLATHWNLGSPDNLFIKFSIKRDPVASIDAPRRGLVSVPVVFDGSSSIDPDGAIQAYEWEFGDGERSGPSTEPVVTHTYAAPGSYAVRLTVYDDYEGDAQTGLDLVVAGENSPPVALIEAPRAERAGNEVTFDGSASHDPDGVIVQYEWEMGDGTTLKGPIVSHVFSHPGVTSVALTVIDDEGASNTHQFEHVVRGPPSA